jgi:rod shape-determining protein MreC
VYDKTVRRRRAVLGLLVALSLILLTAYFGEAAGGGLHSVQRGFLQVVSPIQDGASRALKPVRDLFGWFGDTINAKGQRDSLRKQLDLLRAQQITNLAAVRQDQQLTAMLGLDRELSLTDYTPVAARVIGRSPTLWYSVINVDRGSSDGVHLDDPVIDGDGLLGKVTTVTPGASVVTLITDHTSGVSARVLQSGAQGIVQPAVGDPNGLVLSNLQPNDIVRVGNDIVTSGTISSRLDSVFPRGVPVGKVTSVDNSSPYNKSVKVSPDANLGQLDYVQILMRHNNGARG